MSKTKKAPEIKFEEDSAELNDSNDSNDSNNSDNSDNSDNELDNDLIAARDMRINDLDIGLNLVDELKRKNANLKKKITSNKLIRLAPTDVDHSEAESNSNSEAESNSDSEEKTEAITKKPRQTIKKVSELSKSKPKTTKTPTRKGPGRPRKNPKKEPIPRKGISKNPQNADSFIEVLYDQPIIMKKIFSFFRSIASNQIQIIFRPKEIIFYAVDHHDKTKIRVRVNTEKINHYYCRDVLDVGISTKEMDTILNKVDKEYTSMVILSDIKSAKRSITMVFENDIQIDELHQLDLIGTYNKMENEEEFIDENYTIKFEFPGKYFKKTIGDIKSLSSQLSILQEDNESPIVFEYLASNLRIHSKHTVKDGKKIKLISNLPEGDSFRVDIRIDYLKPISSSQIADDISILVDENKSFMTIAYIDDKTIEIKTLTEIIDERPEDDDE